MRITNSPNGTNNTATITPEKMNDPSQPNTSITTRITGTTTIPASEKPVARIPIATARRRSNQREINA